MLPTQAPYTAQDMAANGTLGAETRISRAGDGVCDQARNENVRSVVPRDLLSDFTRAAERPGGMHAGHPLRDSNGGRRGTPIPKRLRPGTYGRSEMVFDSVEGFIGAGTAADPLRLAVRDTVDVRTPTRLQEDSVVLGSSWEHREELSSQVPSE